MRNKQVANIELVKQVNTGSVYRLIDKEKLISRVELARQSELAPASITKMTRQLLKAGLIKEVALQASTGGRPAISLTCERDKFVFISCKMGRNNLTLALHNIAGDKLVSTKQPIRVEKQIHNESEIKNEDPVLTFFFTELTDFLNTNYDSQTHHLFAIAITLPGLVDSLSGTVEYLPKHNLRNIPLARLVTERFKVPTYIGNHTQSLSLAELYFGAAQDCQDSVLLSVHEGVGAGIINSGKIFTNFNHQLGEIGHIKVEPLGLRCHCGNHGCLETIASNDAIIRQIIDLIEQGHPTSLTSVDLTTGESAIEAVCDAASNGDKLATQVLQHVSQILGQAIAIIINLLNPQKILIKGEIVRAQEIVFPAIEKSVKQYALGSFLPHFSMTAAAFQNEPSMAGVALVRKALLEGNLLHHIMNSVAESNSLLPADAHG